MRKKEGRCAWTLFKMGFVSIKRKLNCKRKEIFKNVGIIVCSWSAVSEVIVFLVKSWTWTLPETMWQNWRLTLDQSDFSTYQHMLADNAAKSSGVCRQSTKRELHTEREPWRPVEDSLKYSAEYWLVHTWKETTQGWGKNHKRRLEGIVPVSISQIG